MPHRDDDWSDSDDEDLAQVETSVLLGVPDGVVETITDISDAAVSRVGGHPVRSCTIVSSIPTYSRTRPFFLLVNHLCLRPNASSVRTLPSY